MSVTLVPMNAGQGTVSVRLTISGIVVWHYAYESRDVSPTGSGSSNTPITFDLGQPERLSHETDGWNVAATNPAAGDAQYSVSIEWLQAGNVIASWRDPASGTTTVKSSTAVVSTGQAFLIAV